jgi:hypothetical protein
MFIKTRHAAEELIGKFVHYAGDNRDYLRGRNGKVVSYSERSGQISLGVEFVNDQGGSVVEWGADWVWNLTNNEPKLTDLIDVDEAFAAAVGGPREQIRAEIERLTNRIAELQIALKVIDSL